LRLSLRIFFFFHFQRWRARVFLNRLESFALVLNHFTNYAFFTLCFNLSFLLPHFLQVSGFFPSEPRFFALHRMQIHILMNNRLSASSNLAIHIITKTQTLLIILL